MDVQQLVGAILASTNPDASIRKAGEDALRMQHLTRGGTTSLLRVALEETLEPSVRQVASITFKNAVKRDWEHKEGRPCQICPEDKAAVRQLVIEGVVRAPPTVRVQLEEALKMIVTSDFPEHWPDLVPALVSALGSGDQALVSGALRTLRIIVRKYEFRDDAERIPLLVAVDASFPTVLIVFQTLLANPAPSPELAELFKLCCKILWSSCYMEIPPILQRENQFSGWMTALLGLAGRAVPTEGAPEDLELRKQWPWWKAKKWVYHVMYRMFTRYGDPRRCTVQHDVAFSQRWKAECCMPFLMAILQELSSIARGEWMPPRVSNILLQYVAEAIKHADTWKMLKPHIHDILKHAVFPLLSFDEEDEELWRDDPQEYVRKGYDVIEDIYSSKTAAMGVMHALCTYRKKSQLDPVMALVVGAMNECAPAAAAAGATAAARRLDGALLAVGTLADTLKKESRYRAQLEPMLQQHVAPLFASPHGHLRSKGCWLAGQYADTEFREGQGRGATFNALLQCVIHALSDPELPVRVDAGVAVRCFVDAVEAEDLGPLRQLVPGLLHSFLAILQEIDSEELTSSLETLVERFGADMGPYATGVVEALVQQFWRAVAEEEGANGGAAEEADDDDFSGGVLAGYSHLRALCTVLEAVSSLPELYPRMEDMLYPILAKYTSDEGLDVFEEITQLITYLTYYAPAITPRMWSLYPRLLTCLNEWAVDYWQDALLPLDNFISRGTEAFLTVSTAPSLLDMTNATIEKALMVGPTAPATVAAAAAAAGSGSLEEVADSETAAEAAMSAAQLVSVILQNCKGRVDHCVAPYLALLTAQLTSGKKTEREVQDALLVACADALYYNPTLALNALSASGALPAFMAALSGAIAAKRKTGAMRHFPGKRDKKVMVLGLISVLGVPAAALPPGLAGTLPQVTIAVMQVLRALKAQEEIAAGKVEIRSEGGSSSSDGLGRLGAASGNESDDDESDEDEDERDVGQERLDRMAAAAARRAGHAEVDEDDWDSGDDWWSDEEGAEVASPIDAVSPYIYFAETLQRVQRSDPGTFAAIMSHMDAGTQQAVQGMMAFAASEAAAAAGRQ